MRWTISRQILAGYAASLLFLLIFGVIAFRVSEDMLKSFENRKKSSQIITQAEITLSLAQDAETGQRGFIITGVETYLEPHARAVQQLPMTLAQLRKTMVSAGRDVSMLPELEEKITGKLTHMDRTIQMRRSNGLQAAADIVGTNAGKQIMDRIREIIGQITAVEQAEFEKSSERAQKDSDIFKTVLFLGLAISAIAMLLVGVVTARSITRPLNSIAVAAQRIASGDLNVDIPNNSTAEEVRSLAKSFTHMVTGLKQSAQLSERMAAGDLTLEVQPQSDADIVGKAQAGMIQKLSELVEQVQRSGVQVNSAAVQIAASGKEQQSTATETASTTTEIGATAKEMSATSTELLKAADNVNAVSQQLSGLAVGGKEGLNRLEQIMRQIMDASSSITSRLGEMNDKAGNISSVVTTITKIADQTNLLSLNAAIEAEKAGEYGRGFSVVASEIRRLADQTAASTLDIEQMVKEMLGSVSAGVMGMDKFSEEVRRSAREVTDVSKQIDQMIERVQSVAPSIESVYEGMQAQTQGSNQISEALAQLGDAARQTAETIRESNRAVEQLNDASRGLQTAISRFKLR